MTRWITERTGALKVVGTWFASLLLLCILWLASILYFLGNAEKAKAIRLTANRIRVHELEARRAEKDFILRSLTDDSFFQTGRSVYLERHAAEVKALRNEIMRLGRQVPSSQKERTLELLDSVERYELGFQGLVSAYRERGFEQWGLEGARRTTLEALRRIASLCRSQELERLTLHLGRDERDFLRQRRSETTDRVTARLAAIREAATKESTREIARSVLEAVQEHEVAFTELLHLERRIGFTEELGLQGDLRQAIHAVEPAVEAVLADAVRADEAANRRLFVGLLVNCLIMAVVLALAVFFAQAARLRNRKLVEMNRQMEREHAKLLQSERLAAIGQMVAGLAHESRNAFQRTHACLDMLSQEIQDRPGALELVGRIEESQDHIHLLYEQVREYAAPVRVRCAPARLDEVVQSAWSRLELLHQQRRVRFVQHLDGVDPSCEVDSFALEQVFRNIFENSLAACDDPVEIDVCYRDRVIDSQPMMQVSVSDNGPGLDPDQKERVFEPFYTTKTKGTGLGMAIARRLVQAHGGTIDVDPTTGRGMTLVVTLPRATKGEG